MSEPEELEQPPRGADFTYEGSRGITGPFLQKLGASGTVVAPSRSSGMAI
ncbi:MAG: hypothetical protein QOJ42_1352 [Acidobacteriaceae bacterium]|jgi:hypothetical protein|nr:hypothetical protein [Acidobacteriaceae bacterium]MDX6460550.1 hypothetical protein [Acidobacteriaceae bacterium]